MATNSRVRIDSDIEVYLRSQSERVIGITPDKLTAADLTTLTNRVLYEHKLAQTMMRQEFISRVFGWLKGVLPGMGGNGSKVVAIAPQSQQPVLPGDDLDFAADFAAQFDENAA
ncbi:hypothetical protein AVDCRST_MAG92-4603 [uncultured Coleofasciculus sp.]|uniref:Uncharacterized protein n=1 Tax=uncultured Coleofasciculus sp. TaxID=1267456 RepID=A0A6J4K339_9CYAN|nr:hypothetical protein AVDCRST_MAG92-4603 [uncultured Coleofasciculus sp.]